MRLCVGQREAEKAQGAVQVSLAHGRKSLRAQRRMDDHTVPAAMHAPDGFRPI